jgi:oligoendopeptidase F
VGEIVKILTLTGTYAELSVSVDHTNNENQDRAMKFMNIASEISSRISFVDSEIIQSDERVIEDA